MTDLAVKEPLAGNDVESLSPAPAPDSIWSCATLVVQLFVALAICAMDRSIIALLIIPMAAEMNWRLSVEGLIIAALFAGYMMTGVISGRVADASGGKRVLAAGVVLWSVMTALTPLAARFGGLPVLLVVRFLVGAGEGAAMPAMNAMVKAGVPEALISRALAFIYSGMYVGSILGLVATPPLMHVGGSWSFPFYAFGAFGVAWTALFMVSVQDLQPNQRAGRRLSTRFQPLGDSFSLADLDDGTGEEGALDDAETVPQLSTLLQEKAVLAILFAHFTATTGFFIMVVWLPTFLVSRFNATLSKSAAFSVAPYALMFFTSNLSGYGADRLISSGADTTRVRKIMQTIGFIGPSLFLVCTIFAWSAFSATLFITLGLGLHAFSHAGVYCNHQDVASGKAVAGVLLGLSNTGLLTVFLVNVDNSTRGGPATDSFSVIELCFVFLLVVASIPGILGVGIAGLIADFSGGNWNLIFLGTIAQYLLGTAVYLMYGSSAKIF